MLSESAVRANANRTGKRGLALRIDLPIIIHIGKGEPKGCWIKQRCHTKNCNKEVCYWALSGKALQRYKNAKCEEHQ